MIAPVVVLSEAGLANSASYGQVLQEPVLRALLE
jgi:hypothetical protein